MSNIHAWRVRGVRAALAATTASALVVSGAVFAVAASAAGTATQLVIATQPSPGAVSGQPLGTQPVVQVHDAAGNVTNATGPVTVTSTCALSGTTSVTPANGVATFSNLTLTGTSGTSCTLTFASTGLKSAVSHAVLLSGPATHLVITTQPSSRVASGVALATVPVVKVEDAAGNVVTSDVSTVTATITSGGVSVTNGTQHAVNGVATFTGLALNARVGDYSLTFSDGALAAASSAKVTVAVGPATQLKVVTEPSPVAKSGVALAVAPVVAVADSGGNVVTSVKSGVATASIVSGSGGTISAGIVATFVKGVATFSGLTLTGTSGATYGLAYSGGGFRVVDAARITVGAVQVPLVITTTRAVLGRTLRLATSGGSGSGLVSYAVANGTAQGCRLSGAVLYYSSAGTCIVTATKAASATYQRESSSATPVHVVKLAIPHIVNVYFKNNTTMLSTVARRNLTVLVRSLTPRSYVKVIGFAPHNLRLARARAVVVKNFLNARVHSHFSVVGQANTQLRSARVVTLAQ